MSKPPILYYLTVQRLRDGKQYRCKMLADSLDEAMRTARTIYGPIKLLSSGTRDLALGSLCLGSGRFISTRHDRYIEPKIMELLNEPSA